MPLCSPHRKRPFRSESPPLVFPRAQLYRDRLELTGWCLSGRYGRSVLLTRVLYAEMNRHRLVLWLDTGDALRLHLPNADEWKRAIEATAGSQLPDRRTVEAVIG